ncbi:MAG: flagellar biosynthesis protein FlhB [Acetobacterales bacterium]
MADDDRDQSEKTEEPTDKKLEDARERGEVIQSQEIRSFAVFAAATLLLVTSFPSAMLDIARHLRVFIARPHALPVDGTGLGRMLVQTVGNVAAELAIPMAVMIVIVLGSILAQVGFLWAPAVLTPNLNKLNPIKGAKKIFSLKNFVEFLKSVVKFSAILALLYLVIRPEVPALVNMGGLEVPQILARIYDMVVKLFMAMVVLVAVIAALDYLYQRHEFMKKNRMARTEVKDEHKQTQGDPHVRSRIRQIRSERSRQRMMQAVPGADVVITNPTHFAVALKYDMDSMAAPEMVAKGADLIAHSIRRVAEENDIPIVENPPLARALFAGVEVGQSVPEEHYKAVAEVIGYVYRVKGKMAS